MQKNLNVELDYFLCIYRSAAMKLACEGFNLPGYIGLGYNMNDPECAVVPDTSTFIQLPWKPEYAWMAW